MTKQVSATTTQPQSQRPQPKPRPAKQAKSGTQGMKCLITAASIAATLAGWAAFTGADARSASPTPAAPFIASAVAGDPAPATPPSQVYIGQDLTVQASSQLSQPTPALQAADPALSPPQLRVVQAPPPQARKPAPVARTRSSR